jgi:hypothetical protein
MSADAERRGLGVALTLWALAGVAMLLFTDALFAALFFGVVGLLMLWLLLGAVLFVISLTVAWRGRQRRTALALPLIVPAIVILLAAASAHRPRLGFAGLGSSCCDHPSDAELIHRLEVHRADFERLVAMSATDSSVIRVAPSFTRLEDNWAWPRSDDLLGFSPERWREYRQLFDRLDLENGLERVNGEHAAVYLLASAFGLVTGGSSKGYVHATQSPGRLYASLDAPPADIESNVTVYRHVGGSWYLYYEWDD